MIFSSRWLTLCLLAPLFVACTATYPVRTVGRGNLGLDVSAGGPMTTNLGPALPIPNAFVGARYGLLDDLDVSAQYNLTAPVIPGLPLDLLTAAHWVPVQPGIGWQASTPERGLGLSASFSLHWMSDFETGLMVVPTIDLAAGYRYRWFNGFVGLAVAYVYPRPFGAGDAPNISPYAGLELILTRRTAVSLKVTFFDVAYNLAGAQVDWVYLHEDSAAAELYGVLGLTLGFSYTFEDPFGRNR